ncbi:MAG: 50S ribosomal protein L11 methyltransferase [Helicobacter sp.]|nr:50S ribosomal protein L11 methyltransferase [Helicobacter sp.]
MDSCYNSLIVKTDNFLWLLKNKALEITNEAIEEIENGFIIRTFNDTRDIRFELQYFTKNLESIMGQRVSLEFEEIQEKNQDWIEKYYRSINPFEYGKFYIHPSWYANKEGKINITIDPALAFGSGHHGSTFGCIKMLDSLVLENKKILDVGCGSGILSILAKKCKAEVWSCDTDSIAVESTQANMLKNNVTIDYIWEGSLEKIKNKEGYFDIVIANILADVLIVLPLDRFVKKGGILILSGILEKYESKVLDKFKNLKKLNGETIEEWVTLALNKN